MVSTVSRPLFLDNGSNAPNCSVTHELVSHGKNKEPYVSFSTIGNRGYWVSIGDFLLKGGMVYWVKAQARGMFLGHSSPRTIIEVVVHVLQSFFVHMWPAKVGKQKRTLHWEVVEQ